MIIVDVSHIVVITVLQKNITCKHYNKKIVITFIKCYRIEVPPCTGSETHVALTGNSIPSLFYFNFYIFIYPSLSDTDSDG